MHAVDETNRRCFEILVKGTGAGNYQRVIPQRPRRAPQFRCRAVLARQIRRHRSATVSDAEQKTSAFHSLRHSSAMELLAAGVETSVIALWLGHENVETTQIYLHAHLALKEAALAKTRPLTGKQARFRPSDKLLEFLNAL